MAYYNRKDHFYHKAKAEGFVARSAYKLKELDEKFGIIKSKSKIIDLGCAPGGWLQVLEEKLEGKPGARIVGIDLAPLAFTPDKTIFIQGDFLEEANQQKVKEALGGKADWILSDMAPKLSGIKFNDLARSQELCEAAGAFARDMLAPKGGLVMKIFPGPEFDKLKKELRRKFVRFVDFVPESTRTTSNEVYLVAVGFKGE